MSDAMELETADGIAHIRLAGGAIDLAWTQELLALAESLQVAGDVRVVRLSSAGRFFCPGGDVKWMQAQEDLSAGLLELAGTLHAALKVLALLDAPVVGEVAGTAAGAGMSLVLGCDLAYAARSASFTMAYTGVGLSPDGGSSWLLPRLVGRREAQRIMLLNPKLSADEVAASGVVTAAVDDEELSSVVDGVVAQLAAGPTSSYGAVKRLLEASSQQGLADQLALEAETIAASAATPAGREGISAFAERRTPAFPPPVAS